jgi:hypothetical protein
MTVSLGFCGEGTNLSLLKIGKSPTKWRHQVSLGDSKNAGYGLLQFMAIFWFETVIEPWISFIIFFEDPVWIIENYLFCCSPISLRHVTPYLTWYPLAGTTPMKCRPFSQMGIEAFLPKPLKMEFC